MQNDRSKMNITLEDQYNSQYGVSPVPAHTHNGTDSMLVDEKNLVNKKEFILYRIVAPATNTAVASTVGGDYVMPYNGYVTNLGVTVDTAGITGTTTVDFKKSGVSILKTLVTVDSTEKTSRTAAIPPIINQNLQNFNIGDIFTFDITAISATPAKGATIFMEVIRI